MPPNILKNIYNKSLSENILFFKKVKEKTSVQECKQHDV